MPSDYQNSKGKERRPRGGLLEGARESARGALEVQRQALHSAKDIVARLLLLAIVVAVALSF